MTNKKLQKIIFSSLALVLSFIIKIELVDELLQIFSSFVLLEEEIKETISKLKQKNIINKHFLLCLMSISFIFLGHYILLLEFLIFYTLEEYIVEIFLDKAQDKNIKTLKKEREETTLKTVSGHVKIKWQDVKVGDILYIKKNEVCLIEGILISENVSYKSFFEEDTKKIITGDNVPSGCIFESDALIKVEKTYESSFYNQMIKRLENIEENENIIGVEKIENAFQKIFTVIILFYTFISILYLKNNISFAILILFSSFSLLIENNLLKLVKNTYFNSLIKMLKKGIYFTQKNIFEKTKEIKIILFSKFGVLTKGELTVSKIIPVYKTKDEVLKIAAYLEYGSTHPMAKAILKQYNQKIETENIYSIEEIKGMGKKGIIEGMEVYIGNELLFDKLNITYPKVEFLEPTCMLAIDNTYVATFVFNDIVKEDSYLVSSLLRETGIEKVVLFSSSKAEQIKKLGNNLSINESYAALTLEDKIEVLKMYKKEGTTMYVDAFLMNEEMKKNTDLSVLCGSSNNADIILPDFDINNLVYIRKESLLLDKTLKIYLISYFLIKLILFIFIITNILQIPTTMFIILIYYLILVVYSMKSLRS